MPENEERVGFEAYFETREFEEGIKRFDAGLKQAGKSSDNFLDKITNFRTQIGKGIMGALGGILGSKIGMPGLGASLGSALGGIMNALNPITLVMKGISAGIKNITSIFKVLGGVGQAAFNIIGTAAKGVLIALGSVAALVTGGLMAGFLLLRRTVSDIFSALTNKFEEFFEQAIAFQRIDTALQALVRTALVAEGSFERAGDAVAAAIPIAEELSVALQQMAMKSPFTLEYVYTIFRTNAAYGLAIDTAYRLTDAIIQVGAATGFSATVLERIARNFAQVARNGRIWQRDIYELANAGLDMHRILDEELGMSVEQFNEGVQQGTVSVNDLIEALITFVSKNFEGSAEALSLTIEGLKNRFQTLGGVIVKDFVTPLIQMAAPALNKLFDALMLVAATDVFKLFGQTVANMAKKVVGDMDWTVDSIAQKIMDLLLWVAEAAGKFFRW
jgi:tape measure domain-containing protein